MVPPSTIVDEPDSALEKAWEEVDRAWEDDEAHRRFLALASSLGRLDVAGARYRAVRDADPARRPRAEAQIGRLLGLAYAALGATKSPKADDARRWVNLAAVVLVLTLVGLATWALLRLR